MRKSFSFAALLTAALFGPVAAAQPRPSVTLVPGTVNAGGLNGTRFVSDLAITNPSPVPVSVILTLVPANGTSLAFASVNPGETVVYRNVLDSVWGAQGAGATQVVGTGPLLVRGRTYNTASSGTYGVALPVFAYERLLAPGDAADSLWISQSANGSSGYRTNIAVVFPDSGGGSALVSVYDADGNLAGTQAFDLGEPGFQQFSVASFAGAVPVARAQIQVMGGHAAGYAVVVDNVTGDSSLFAFEDLPAGTQDVLVNGVARANGRNDTFFRTDGRFYNQGSTDATVSVAFHANQNSNPAPLTRTFTVPAGKIRDVVDVLDSLLGLPVGSAGALRFKSDAPVAILCRTSNVDPAGIRPGTFGAQQKPTPLLSFLMSADAGAVVTGIRQNATFRTNVGFAAGADGAGYTLTLKDSSGEVVATATGSLGAFGWTQPNVADLFPGTTVPDDATLLVRVTAGSVDVFDSSIDNASGDPVVTPIMSLPAEIPSAATIGPAGGSVRSSDGRMTLKIPRARSRRPRTFPSARLPPSRRMESGPDTRCRSPRRSRDARYSSRPDFAADLGASGSEALSLAFKGGDGWYVGTGGSVDASARTLSLLLRSITPPGSPSLHAAARQQSALSSIPLFDITLAILNAWRIVPDKVVLLTYGEQTFSALFAGVPPSSSNAQAFFLKASDPVNVKVDWRVGAVPGGGRSEGRVQSISPTEGRYFAPCLAPPINPVFLAYFISDARFGSFSPTAFHAAKVYVLPRNWVGEADLDVELCGISGGGFYSYKKATVTFSLDDDFNVVNVASAGAIPAKITSLCPGRAGDSCSYTPGPAPAAPLEVTGATAKDLLISFGAPEFGIMIKYPETPTVTETCADHTKVIPGSHQTPPIETSVNIPHAPDFISTDLLGLQGITTRLRAVPDPGCP